MKRVREVDEVRERWLAMVNGWDPARRRSCGGEKGEMLRREWSREVDELGRLVVLAALSLTQRPRRSRVRCGW